MGKGRVEGMSFDLRQLWVQTLPPLFTHCVVVSRLKSSCKSGALGGHLMDWVEDLMRSCVYSIAQSWGLVPTQVTACLYIYHCCCCHHHNLNSQNPCCPLANAKPFLPRLEFREFVLLKFCLLLLPYPRGKGQGAAGNFVENISDESKPGSIFSLLSPFLFFC